MKLGEDIKKEKVLEIPNFLKQPQQNDNMVEGIMGEVETVLKEEVSELDEVNKIKLQTGEESMNSRHLKDLEMQARAMSLEEQRAIVKGIHPCVMLDDLARTFVELNQKLKNVEKVIGNAE